MNTLQNIKNNKQPLAMFGFGLITILLWNLPFGMLILYPFTILGTWFHEICHGLTAELLGGNFVQLVMNPDGSGYAQFTYNTLFLGFIGKALVAMAGPFGPTLAGSIFVVSSINLRASKIILFLFSVLLLISSIIWVRPIISFGFLMVVLFTIIFMFVSLSKNDNLKRMTIQFIGIQAFASVYLSIGYLFSNGGTINGQVFKSDTQVVAENLILPYWFWGGFILIFSIIMFTISFSYYFKKVKN